TGNLAADRPEKVRELAALWRKQLADYAALAAKDEPLESETGPNHRSCLPMSGKAAAAGSGSRGLRDRFGKPGFRPHGAADSRRSPRCPCCADPLPAFEPDP